MVKGIVKQKQVLEKDYELLEKPLLVDVYNDFEPLRAIQKQWDQLVESVGGEIFLTYDWCRIWWKYYGKNRVLRIFLFRIDEELVGIIPMFFEKVRIGPISVNAGKIVGSDFTLIQFCPPILDDYIGLVINKLSNALMEEKWEIIHFGPIAGLYKHYDRLREAFKRSFKKSFSVLEKHNGDQTYFELADNWETHLSSINKNERGNIRRNYNYLHKKLCGKEAGIESSFATADSLESYFSEFVKMHEEHWNRLGKGGHFIDWPYAEKFHREQAQTHLEHDRLRLLKTSLGNDCFGYQYHYRFGDKYVHFLDSRNNLSSLKDVSPGRITFCEQVKKAIDEHVRYIDSMRGRYEHKLRLGGKLYPLRNIYVYRNKLPVWLRLSVFRIIAQLFKLFYYKIWFCRLAPRLPFKRKPLWESWIKTSTLV